ncbi:Apoptotic chromatin condensation inducer [Spatholobus suberectus]|nr:Apoptotic chromatin condensation inducer [Spatholobus suberectus]
MSSRYPILDNRPIDQWKVTELREELKRRKLTTKGLKDDLIKRLDEALHIERETAEDSKKEEVNGFNGDVAGLSNLHMETVVADVADAIVGKSAEMVETTEKGDTTVLVDINSSVPEVHQEVEHMDFSAGQDSANVGEDLIVRESDETVEMTDHTAIVEPIETENAEKIPKVVDNDSKKSDKLYGVTIPLDFNSSVPAVDQEVERLDFPAGEDSTNVGEGLNVHASTIETTVTVTESVLTEVVLSGQESCSAEPQNDHGQESVTKQENDESEAWLDKEDSKPQMECDLKLPCEDLKPNSSLLENQVSEVNPSLGSQVNSDSISSNSVSINQKNKLKDTIIADNVKLEQDIVRPDMVKEPLSRNDVPIYDESHSMDVGELHEKKASFEENSSNNRSPDFNKINSSKDVGYPEKLNLDRSSGDDSMEEDLPQSKQFDSKFNVNELRDKGEIVEVSIVKEEGSTVIVGEGSSSEKGGAHHANDIPSIPVIEKRKFCDQALVGNNGLAKRQRRWNSETVKGSDPQSPTVRPATTPKDEPVASKHRFSRSASSAVDDAPKERIVPQSQSAPTNSLRIDHFIRPFTLKAVQELLGKTGNVISFWMDHIKTHCYVTYSSVEEAIETRNAVYNLQWPPNGGRLLVAEYVDPQEVKMKLEAPPTQVAPVSNNSTVPSATPTSLPEPSPRQYREQPPVAATLPPPPPLSRPPPAAREPLPSPPPLPKKIDQPFVTLDDLFRKTGATPRIYYLPLSDEQVAAKLAAQGRSSKQ